MGEYFKSQSSLQQFHTGWLLLRELPSIDDYDSIDAHAHLLFQAPPPEVDHLTTMVGGYGPEWPVRLEHSNTFDIETSVSTRANPLAMAPTVLFTRPNVTSCPVLLKSSTQQS